MFDWNYFFLVFQENGFPTFQVLSYNVQSRNKPIVPSLCLHVYKCPADTAIFRSNLNKKIPLCQRVTISIFCLLYHNTILVASFLNFLTVAIGMNSRKPQFVSIIFGANVAL